MILAQIALLTIFKFLIHILTQIMLQQILIFIVGYDSSSSNLAYYQRGIRTNIAASDDVSVYLGNMVAISSSDDYYAIQGSQNNQVIRLYILTEIAPSITVSDIAPSFNSQDTSNIAYYETEMTINNQECTATTHNINLS